VTRLTFSLLLAALTTLVPTCRAETGYDLWLRYARLPESSEPLSYRQFVTAIVVPKRSPTRDIVAAELRRGLLALLGADVPISDEVRGAGAVVIGTPTSSPAVAALGWQQRLAALGTEGYLIRSTTIGGHPMTAIASAGEAGTLYGTFHFLRLIQTGRPLARLDIAERPRLDRRLLNHWDNLDGTIERGYAGASLWPWAELPDRIGLVFSTTPARMLLSASTAPSSTA